MIDCVKLAVVLEQGLLSMVGLFISIIGSTFKMFGVSSISALARSYSRTTKV